MSRFIHAAERNHNRGKLITENGYEKSQCRTKDVDAELSKEWLNEQLEKVGGFVEDLSEDLRDGRNLILLLEVLAGERISRKRGRLRVHMLENVRAVLDFLESYERIDTANIDARGIVDGDRTVTLRLVSTIMLHYQQSHKPSMPNGNAGMNGSIDGPVGMNGVKVGKKLASHAKPKENGVSGAAETEDFWKKRIESVRQLELPYETNANESAPRWEVTGWSKALLDAELGDAKLILLDAFVIYLARIVGESRIQIGLNVERSEDEEDGSSGVAVPMVITVPFEEPWSSVSEAVNGELALLSRSGQIPCHLVSQDSVKSDKTVSPWRILVSLVKHRKTEKSAVRGKVLTLEIDTRGAWRWIYDGSQLSGVVVQRIGSHLQELVRASLAENAETTPICNLNLLPEKERTLLLKGWNDLRDEPPVQRCIHQFFEDQVEKAPGAVALVYEDETVTYGELNSRANRLARRLIELGVGPEQLVALCVSTSPATLVGILAILKAGGAYVPVDPAYPSQRLVDTLNDAAPKVVVADEVGRDALSGVDLSSISVIDPNASLTRSDSNPRVTELSPKNMAYVIYTSGSTGKPKGVMVEHRNVVRLFDVAQPLYNFDNNDVWPLFHSVAFDVSVFEIWGALRFGGRLVLVPRSVARSPIEKQELIRKNRVTVLNQTPSAFRASVSQYGDAAITEHVRYVIFAGESLDISMLRPFFAKTGESTARFVNMYGTTETTVHATYKVLTRENTEESLSVIGRPLADLRFYLLDNYGQPVPLGAVGEIYIGGVGVTRGYMNRPELTAERFVADPFCNAVGARMYKTGDLARYLPDGGMIYLGRNDQQVKIRGFRIELGEIEACLSGYPTVRQAAVIERGDEANKRLVAYVVANAEDNLAGKLHDHMAARLPDYMVPSAFVRLDTFPLTPSGKLDTKALPSVDETALARRNYEPPQGYEEESLATIWSQLLGLERISRLDSFFALGGHSLLAVELIDGMRALGLKLSLSDLFKNPVLFKLARSVEQFSVFEVPPNVITPDVTEITPDMLPLIDLNQGDIDRLVSQVPGGLANVQDIYALSPLQDGILFHYLLATEGDPYLITRQMAFSDRDVLDRYLKAVQIVVDRHDILRTAVFWEDLSTPAQVVLRQARLSVTELECNPHEGSVGELFDRRYGPRQYRMDIREAPLIRFMVARDADGRWILLELLHHLIGDHTTVEVMHLELKAILAGQHNTLTAPSQFRNLVATARLGVSQEAHGQFFEEMLADVDEPTVSFGLSEIHRDGSKVIESIRELPQDLHHRLRALARKLEVSLATLCHVAWAMVVSRTSGNEKVVFGTVLFGRATTGEGSTTALGLFINTLPVRVNIDGASVQDCIRETHIRLANLLEHEHASLAAAQRCSGVTGGKPLFNTMLNYRHNSTAVDFNDVAEGVEFLIEVERTNYPLTLSVDDNGTSVGLVGQAVEPVDPERLCAYMQQALESLHESLTLAPESPVRFLEVLPPTERTLLLHTWNSVEKPAKIDPTCIHQLFEQNARDRPESIALVYEDQTVTYAELNARANRLAHRLIELGIGPDDIVGLCVSVTPALITGLLGILKAGGAYLPLDPTNPSQRLRDILHDAAPKVVIADDMGRGVMDGVDTSAMTLVDPNEALPHSDKNPEVPGLTSRNLVYLIFTSGSTGRPKGVMVEHHHVVRLFNVMQPLFHFTHEDVFALSHSVGFDVSVFEIWGSLRFGGRLVLVPRSMTRLTHEKHEFIRKHRLTVFNQTPSAFRSLIPRDGEASLPDHLRYVVFIGESLDTSILLPFFSKQGNQCLQFVNMYGPTETIVVSTHKVVRLPDIERSLNSIGRRLSDLKLYLLDPHQRPVPLGIIGELYIGGAGVARGYLNRPDLTQERFLPDPFDGDADARMYKTGDLARYLPDGEMIYVGRIDEQVKIRGYRIEPGEIEACLVSYPGVRQAVVVALDDAGEKYLVAYVVADSDDNLAYSLRTYLTPRLPEYMIPTRFVRVDAIPMSPSGKIDTKALPAPDAGAFAHEAYSAPEGDTETILALIWSQLLGIERVGRNDNFFVLGGHSLLAMQMTNLAGDRGLACTLNDLFQFPVLADLAAKITPDLTTKRRYDAIPVRSAGTEAPIFFAPTGLGDFSYVFSLSRHIRSSCPIYALPWPGLQEEPVATIEELATKMASLIKAVQPKGPYRICGYSTGGILSHAIAKALLDAGDSVSFLGFIDTPIPNDTPKGVSLKRYLFTHDLVLKCGFERRDDIAALSRQIDALNWIEFIRAAQKLQLYPANLRPEIYSKQLEQRISYGELAKRYVPRELGLVIHQFNAVEPYDLSSMIDAQAPYVHDPSMGWTNLMTNTSFKLTQIPGDHNTIMEVNENRSVLGRAISEAVADDR